VNVTDLIPETSGEPIVQVKGGFVSSTGAALSSQISDTSLLDPKKL
jgi:hypothetical protein